MVSLFLTSSLWLTGFNFPCGWHHLHDWKHGTYYNWLDLQSPIFQASLTQEKVLFFLLEMVANYAPKDMWVILIITRRFQGRLLGTSPGTFRRENRHFLSRMAVCVFKICGAHFYPGFTRAVWNDVFLLLYRQSKGSCIQWS